MTVKIRVQGKVQGVYYRVSTREKARSLGLSGYVINQTDGSVSILASGGEDQIKDLINWCKTGVDKARVDKIEHEHIAEMEFSSFVIKK